MTRLDEVYEELHKELDNTDPEFQIGYLMSSVVRLTLLYEREKEKGYEKTT